MIYYLLFPFSFIAVLILKVSIKSSRELSRQDRESYIKNLNELVKGFRSGCSIKSTQSFVQGANGLVQKEKKIQYVKRG